MSVKDEVLKELENHKGEYISGGQLSEVLNVSRNSIWKAIKTLENNGYKIDAIPNRGYCLAQESDILSSFSIKQHMHSDLNITVYPSVSSTNTFLKELAEQGADEGTVIIAQEQTAGRGRTGKSFYSPANTGLYISILLRPDIPAEEALFLTTSTAVAVSKAIEDVFIDNKKVCGILTEASFNIETSKLDYAIVGIGINVCFPEGGFPKDIDNIATAIFDTNTDSINKRSILVGHLLDYFMDYYKDFHSKSYVKDYIDRSRRLGKKIDSRDGTKIIPAKALKVDNSCRLKVEMEDGSTKWLSSGEVSIKLN